MPHELAETNGKKAMAFFGETPWHGLGTRLDNPATAEEAIAPAGLNYDVALTPITTIDGQPIPDRRAVVRSDSSSVLGVVGKSYQPVQNRQCFGFLDAVVADGRLRYHTAGALGQGERVWMLAKLPDEIRVKNSEDVTEQFLLLSNSHDGSSSLRVFFTPIRVVCANTLGTAERRSRGSGVSIVHKGDLAAKVREAQEILGLAKRFYDDLGERINRLASHRPSRRQLETYYESLYPDRANGQNNRAANIRSRLFELFEHGIGQDMPAIRQTTWAAFNAVTEYVDRHRSTRGRTDFDRRSRRLESAWFGSGSRLKSKAWTLALEMAS
jgi:phage/plasmid-like protein (TIGR03299 family)